MTGWRELSREIAHWHEADRTPTLWWRDDDARAPSDALERLIALSDRHRVPAHLAVIPQGLSPALAPRLRAARNLHVLQHGLAHLNHEPEGRPASEIGEHRPLSAQRADLQDGWQRLGEAELPGLLPVLVPPWNRIATATRRALPRLGFRALSSYAGRNDEAPVPGLHQLDAHLDPVRWKAGRVFRGTDKMLAQFRDALRHKRQTGDPTPIGYVTHHLQTGDDVWAFTDELFHRLAGKVRWRSLAEVLKAPP